MPLNSALNRLVSFFTSLRLTVVCLVFGLALVFLGTLAQVHVGLYRAQEEYFRSFFVYWSPGNSSIRIPWFPGGYLVGGLLLINLVASLFSRVAVSQRKAGIWLIHVGLILLLFGQLLTDMLSRESAMELSEGETKNYSEAFRGSELVIIDSTDPKQKTVYSLPEHLLAQQSEIRNPQVPFTIRVKKHWPNLMLVRPAAQNPPMAIPSGATAGELKDLLIIPAPTSTNPDQRNSPGALIELLQGDKSFGTFLVSTLASRSQQFRSGNNSYEVALRLTRYHYPFSITLLKATHETYRGTDIPKNFASRVRIENPAKGENRETEIYMNNPLRYGGNTFYRYQMSAGEMAQRAGAVPTSTFQVVRNPSWLTPYLSTVIISLGLLVQFLSHLWTAVKRRIA